MVEPYDRWTHPDRQASTYPTVISHGFGSGYLEMFDWTGTRDPSAWLAVTAALDLVHTWGAAAIRSYTYTLVRWGAEQLLPPLALPQIPVSPAWTGAMISLPLGKISDGTPQGVTVDQQALRLHDQLWHQYQIEIPIIPFQNQLWIRLSAQIYLEQEDFRHLATALAQVSAIPQIQVAQDGTIDNIGNSEEPLG